MANVTVRLTGTTATMPPPTAPPTSGCSSDNRAPTPRRGEHPSGRPGTAHPRGCTSAQRRSVR
jgi:hypothetical protein